MNDEILKEILEKVEDNTRAIKKINNRLRLQNVVGAIKWLVYFGVIAFVYNYAMMNVQKVLDLYSSVKDTTETVSEMKEKTTSLDFKSMLDLFSRK